MKATGIVRRIDARGIITQNDYIFWKILTKEKTKIKSDRRRLISEKHGIK